MPSKRMVPERFIVAEVSKNYAPTGEPFADTGPLCEQFEAIIARNLVRGYLLHSWRMSRMNDSLGGLNETIIAVFALDTPSSPSLPESP